MTGRTRRDFLAGAAAALAAPHLAAPALADARRTHDLPEGGAPDDERYWAAVRKAYDLPAGIINLDNGNINPASRETINALTAQFRHVETFPPPRNYDLFRTVTKPRVIPALAALLGVDASEVALVRNSTEALDTVILGLRLQPGDEVLCSTHDYYAMLDALEYRRDRDGIVLRMITPPIPAPSMDALAATYERALTPKTRLVLLTNPSNLTGQLVPVRRIADAAHRVGAEVLLDGAQSFGLLPYTMADTGCDYFGASLHKWLGAPIGAGMLWMKPAHVTKVAPLVPAPASIEGMERYMWSGTYPEPLCAAALQALTLHQRIGTGRKGDRLRHLTAYWRDRVEKVPGLRFGTLADRDASCGLALVEIEGITSTALKDTLWAKHRILVQDMSGSARTPEVKGIRVTPNVYTSLGELDRFAAALIAIAAASRR